MSAQHTPGAIRYDYEPGYCGQLIASNGIRVAEFIEEPSEADARRLAACWNACEGIDTVELKTAARYKALMEGYRDLSDQRDELLEALKQARGEVQYMASGMTHSAWRTKQAHDAMANIDAAIAKVEASK